MLYTIYILYIYAIYILYIYHTILSVCVGTCVGTTMPSARRPKVGSKSTGPLDLGTMRI